MTSTITYRGIWKIAYPIILGSVAQNLINVTDTAFLGRVGEVALGAGAIGGIYYFVAVMLAWGFGIGVQIIVARRLGEGKLSDIGKTVEHGLFFLLPLAVVVFAVMKFLSDDLMPAIIRSAEVRDATLEYIGFRAYGIFFVFINILFRSFYVGIGKTKVITMSTVVLAIVNIFFDYCLIFGNLGFPEMGIGGAALASVIAEVSATIFFVTYTFRMIPLSLYRMFYFEGRSLSLYLRIIRIASPMMLQNFLSLGAWLTFFLFVEKMGQTELAVSNIIRSFYVVLMIPMWGFSAATNTIVSYMIGSGKKEEVMTALYKIVRLSTGGVALVVFIGSLFPELVLHIYTNDPVLIQAARPALYVINIAALVLSVAFVFFSGVSGTGKTNVSLIIEIMVIFIYLIFVYVIVHVVRGSVAVVWMSEFLYGGLLALFSYIYLRNGKWKEAAI